MKTEAQAKTWLRQHRIALVAAKVDGVPSLAHEIVKGPIAGSWWSHPKGKLIFALASALEDDGDVLTCKLVEGKATFVHRTLWPQLARVVLDDVWCAARLPLLKPAAQALLAKLEKTGELHGGDAKTVKALEESQLALVVSRHTEKGHHEKVLTAWARWAKEKKVKPAKGSLDAARTRLREAAGGVEVL